LQGAIRRIEPGVDQAARDLLTGEQGMAGERVQHGRCGNQLDFGLGRRVHLLFLQWSRIHDGCGFLWTIRFQNFQFK